VKVAGHRLREILVNLITTPPASTPEYVLQYNAIGPLENYLSPSLWMLALAGLLWGLWRRPRATLLITIWWFVITLSANPAWFGAPGTGIISNFAVFIAIYIPASILIGVLLGEISSLLAPRLTPAVMVLCAIALGLWGAGQRLREINPHQYALVTRPDIRAAEWIREHTDRNARFLVNSFFAYGGTLVVGSDGGWWLPLLAHRRTTLPPLAYASEEGPIPGYIDYVNLLTRVLMETGVDDETFLEMLSERGVTHVYIGQKQGRVNYAGPRMLDPGRLLAHPAFQLRYHEDRVWIFEVMPQAASGATVR
jgi:hypothetical protein